VVASHFGTAIGQYVAAPRPEPASLPVSLPPRAEMLAGREGLLADLHALLAGGDRPWPRTAVLCGLGGAGKTSVAVEYAYRHLAEVAVAWRLAAEDQTVLAAEFGLLAVQLGVWGVADFRDPVRSVHSALAAYPAQWLLIFDNVPDAGSVWKFLPPAGQGRVLITSQNAHWSAGLDVPVLEPQVSAAFLVNRTTDLDMAAAAELADELGGLPLALEQAAAYVKATGLTLAAYLKLFRALRSDLLNRGEVAGHPATVAATLGLALSRLERDAPAAAGLLQFLACLAPEPAPLALLLADAEFLDGLDNDAAAALGTLLGDQLARRDAVAALRRFSLISFSADESVSVHRLVQAVTIGQMSAELASAWRQATTAVLEAAIPGDAAGPGSWPIFAALLPHAQAALGAESEGMGRIASYLGFSGNYTAARELSQQVLEAREPALGPEHPLTLSARASLAYWTGQAGDAAGARDQYAALLPLIERILGAEHPNTLTGRTDLAFWTGRAGNVTGARDQYAESLPLIERILGPEHPHALTDRAHLASWTGAAGDAAGARDQYAALLPIVERVLGPDHPDTLATRANLASWAGEAGDAAKARKLHAALVPDRERILGPEHPDTLSTRANLARWTGRAGDPATACEQYKALLPVRERVSGPTHPLTLIDRANFARLTGEAGDAAGARDHYAALLPMLEQVLGSEHPDTLTARGNLASATGRAGDPAKARDQYAALVPICEQVLGPEHPDTLTTRGHLAAWTAQAGEPGDAYDQYSELLPLIERVLGEEHPDTKTVRENLACCAEKRTPTTGTGGAPYPTASH